MLIRSVIYGTCQEKKTIISQQNIPFKKGTIHSKQNKVGSKPVPSFIIKIPMYCNRVCKMLYLLYVDHLMNQTLKKNI